MMNNGRKIKDVHDDKQTSSKQVIVESNEHLAFYNVDIRNGIIRWYS